jgi:hypothetical protein
MVLLQEPAVGPNAEPIQSTSHFHAPSLKTLCVISFESTEMNPSLKINDSSTNNEFFFIL